MRRRKPVHCHKEFRWFSCCIIDVPNRIRLTTTTSNGKTEIKTDFVSNINGTMLIALNLTQIDGLYCVWFRGTHIRSLRNLTQSFSDRMQIFLVPPGNCSRNWNGFVIVESFHISNAYPHTHPDSSTHTHTLMRITCRETTIISCSVYSLPIFCRRKEKDVFAQGLWWNCLHLWRKKSMKQSTNGAVCWLSAVGFFSLAIKPNTANSQRKESWINTGW